MVITRREIAEQRKCIRCGHQHVTTARYCDGCGFDMECDLQRDFELGWSPRRQGGVVPDAPGALQRAEQDPTSRTLKREFLPAMTGLNEPRDGGSSRVDSADIRAGQSLSLPGHPESPALVWAGITLVVVVHLLTTWLLQG